MIDTGQRVGCRNAAPLGENVFSNCRRLTWQLASMHQTAARSPLSFAHSGMGRRNGQKGKLVG